MATVTKAPAGAATSTTDPREVARQKRNAARHALTEAEQRWGRASHVVQWGSDDPREQAAAFRDIHTLRADAIEARHALEEAEREYLRVAADSAAARAPHYREYHEREVHGIYEAALELIRRCEAVKVTGADAHRECCVNGTWPSPQPYDPSIAEPGEHVRAILDSWARRMRASGWLKD